MKQSQVTGKKRSAESAVGGIEGCSDVPVKKKAALINEKKDESVKSTSNKNKPFGFYSLFQIKDAIPKLRRVKPVFLKEYASLKDLKVAILDNGDNNENENEKKDGESSLSQYSFFKNPSEYRLIVPKPWTIEVNDLIHETLIVKEKMQFKEKDADFKLTDEQLKEFLYDQNTPIESITLENIRSKVNFFKALNTTKIAGIGTEIIKKLGLGLPPPEPRNRDFTEMNKKHMETLMKNLAEKVEIEVIVEDDGNPRKPPKRRKTDLEPMRGIGNSVDFNNFGDFYQKLENLIPKWKQITNKYSSNDSNNNNNNNNNSNDIDSDTFQVFISSIHEDSESESEEEEDEDIQDTQKKQNKDFFFAINVKV